MTISVLIDPTFCARQTIASLVQVLHRLLVLNPGTLSTERYWTP